MANAVFGQGKITQKNIEGKEHLVDINVCMESCRGFTSNVGTATVRLPSKEDINNLPEISCWQSK